MLSGKLRKQTFKREVQALATIIETATTSFKVLMEARLKAILKQLMTQKK